MLRSLGAGLLFVGFSVVGLSAGTLQAEERQAEESMEEVQGVAAAAPIPVPITPELIAAHHAYQLAQLRLQQYRFVELPRQRRLLNDETRLIESEIRVLKRRIRDHRPSALVGRNAPFLRDAERNRLALQATEQELRRIKEERIDQMRYSRQHVQLYQLDVLRTAMRVRQVMAQGAAQN